MGVSDETFFYILGYGYLVTALLLLCLYQFSDCITVPIRNYLHGRSQNNHQRENNDETNWDKKIGLLDDVKI
jgi:hypothetical protein